MRDVLIIVQKVIVVLYSLSNQLILNESLLLDLLTLEA
jgi:hypothetical protein